MTPDGCATRLGTRSLYARSSTIQLLVLDARDFLEQTICACAYPLEEVASRELLRNVCRDAYRVIRHRLQAVQRILGDEQ